MEPEADDLDTRQRGSEDFAYTSRMRQTMASFTTAWGRGDIDALMALFSEDPVYRTSSGAVFRGRAALRDGLVRLCQPSSTAAAPQEAQPRMHFFGRTCLAYWTLKLWNGNVQNVVDGVDVITFDGSARVLVKDAYRKLA